MEAQMEMWKQQKLELEKYEEEKKKGQINDGDVIDISQIVRIENKTYEYDDEKTGGVRKVLRKIYIFSDGNELIVPVSLHKKIITIVDDWGINVKVKVIKTGEKKLTKYDAIPVKG